MLRLYAGLSVLQLQLFLRLLLFLSFASGCAALIYEVVWFQLLQLVIGSSAVSLGVLLGTYMGGMCLGSLLLPRLFSRQWNPLRVFALLEGGIGVLGLLILLVLPEATIIYATRHRQWTGRKPVAGIFGGGVPVATHNFDGSNFANNGALG